MQNRQNQLMSGELFSIRPVVENEKRFSKINAHSICVTDFVLKNRLLGEKPSHRSDYDEFVALIQAFLDATGELDPKSVSQHITFTHHRWVKDGTTFITEPWTCYVRAEVLDRFKCLTFMDLKNDKTD